MSEMKLPPHRKVHVDLGPRAYDVVIGRGVLRFLGDEMQQIGLNGPITMITDENIAAKEEVTNSLLKNAPVGTPIHVQGFHGGYNPEERLILPPGESTKSLDNVAFLLQRIARRKIPRSGIVISVGGGVIGDLAGFVAASYLRGIAFVQIPTTLLSMVDSSVGGKTGVNLPEGKNLVGAFHQPKLVVADLDTLATLPPNQFAAGMAEVIKYGAIRDAALFERVLKGVKPTDADLDEIVEKCVAIKARIVENDEFETKGERALLNFGHTIGHAIEKATTFERERALEEARSIKGVSEREAAEKKAQKLPTYLHGEAISFGMRAAAWLSRRVAGLSQEAARDIDLALLNNNLPVVLKPEVDSKAILAALGNDKKVAADGGNRWVLLPELGKAESGKIISPELVAQAVEYLRTHPDDL